jgi:SAM-dependent methyltransferase
MAIDYSTVTEIAGDDGTNSQIEQICHRYIWASQFCEGRDTIEVACGTGSGLGLIQKKAKSVRAGDYEEKNLQTVRDHYGDRIPIEKTDAQALPYEDDSADLIILFEALYYLPEPEKFVKECRRILRPGGKVLITNANKDLYDFNPSPFSHTYHGVVELGQLFGAKGFKAVSYGRIPIGTVSCRQRSLRWVKAIAAKLRLIPKTMQGKKALKRLIFGKLRPMPREVREDMIDFVAPNEIPQDQPDTSHKFIYCVATLTDK